MDHVGSGHHPRIRPRRPEDLPPAAAVLTAVHALDGYPVEGVERGEAWLTPSGVLLRAWVAELDGRVVGHVVVNRPARDAAVTLWLDAHPDADPERTVTLSRLFVLPEARRQGIAEALVHAATTYARDHGLCLLLDVLAKDTAAERLYERLGWRRFGTAVHTYAGGTRSIGAACYVAPGTAAYGTDRQGTAAR